MSDQKVVICKYLKAELQTFLSALKYDKLFILTDTNTQDKCFPLIQDVPAVQNAPVITVQAGDMHKSLEQMSYIWTRLSNEGASRNSLLINLGGGMITDMGGFAGATFKRGIRTINIPTTLMASVDAAVGGKTGINFNGLKNEIGSFYPPLCVFVDCEFLRTLDRDNLLSGYAEMIKHGLISSMDTYASVMLFDLDQKIDYAFLNRMVAQSVAVKEQIVTEDPKEKGIRKALNFGHTVGHAYESLSFKKKTPLLHGHAVAAGIISELYLSHKICSFPMDKLSQVVYYIKEYYPAFVFDCKDYETLYELMTHDKKNEGGVINFTLLANIGDVRINQDVSKEKILESLDFYRESFGV
ncbi:3-dehydroquinate synthase [Parabacteroides bouchesdurhonensis]|uniref:3-dehydroquinate synthase n=1 Tax=Parabacteroides bouchesdurhonensis TaxID=1936995 RepID=UPI000C85CAEF|nr:3-dehydroquinate synthase [Parabacteroides bouchesdurhonensis]